MFEGNLELQNYINSAFFYEHCYTVSNSRPFRRIHFYLLLGWQCCPSLSRSLLLALPNVDFMVVDEWTPIPIQQTNFIHSWLPRLAFCHSLEYLQSVNYTICAKFKRQSEENCAKQFAKVKESGSQIVRMQLKMK